MPAETRPYGLNLGDGVHVSSVQSCVELCRANCACTAGFAAWRLTGLSTWRMVEPHRPPTPGAGRNGYVCLLRRYPAEVKLLPAQYGRTEKGFEAGPWAFGCAPCPLWPGLQHRPEGRWADDCRHVYLDIGTNNGVQIRKLFEPDLYPMSPVHTIFEQYFGTARHKWRDVCAFGFEPNPERAPRLRHLESLYRSRGWRVSILTGTAVGIENGHMTFHQNSDSGPQLGGALWHRGTGGKAYSVRVIDLPRWLLTHIAERTLPRHSPDDPVPHVVAKLDVEGMEWFLVPELVRSRAVCSINSLFVEFHGGKDGRRVLKEFPAALRQRFPTATADSLQDSIRALARKPGCGVHLEVIDDESYGFESFGDWDRNAFVGGSTAKERELPPVDLLPMAVPEGPPPPSTPGRSRRRLVARDDALHGPSSEP
eukprot:TRINITY_DN31102_c0_g1_i1.p1 TRINITY_DN31102_c0_g1~~TRINITY_DN31102_c0_g1_i1.p1  ORF type:complete len:496 (+),score=69.11 TRINITY_DN31102_c0_g1_i1:217-1488(+)